MSDCERWQEALSAWLDGECSETEHKEVQAHLEQCPACREWLEQAQADQQLFVGSLMGRQADLSDSVMRRVSQMSVEPQPVREKRKPSFRIVELLVVLAIMAVLAAILFPVFGKAREKARQSSCMSNIKQLALATLMYVQDYEGVLPPADRWSEVIQRYAKNPQLLICPTSDSKEIGYAMVGRWSGMPLKSIPNPDQTVLLYEVEHGQPIYRHNGGMNVAYADSHTKWIRKLPADIAPVTAINPAAPDHDYGLRRRLQLAYDASCEVWVKHIQEAVVAAEQAFYQRGGFVLNSTLAQPTGPGACRTAQIEGKVPTAQVGATINDLAALGYVAHREIAGQDLTDQYVTRTRAVTATEEKLGQAEQQQAQAPRANKPALAEQATQAREQLGHAQDTLFGTQRELALATITATLVEKAPEVSVSVGQVARAWRSFAAAAAKVGVALVWVGLYALFLVPVIGGVWLYRRRK